jgi:surface protein
MFNGATAFNGDLSFWAVTSVTDMGSMFKNAIAFNGDLSSWDVASVADMIDMFNGASTFNGNLSAWIVNSVSSCANFCGTSGAICRVPYFSACTSGCDSNASPAVKFHPITVGFCLTASGDDQNAGPIPRPIIIFILISLIILLIILTIIFIVIIIVFLCV